MRIMVTPEEYNNVVWRLSPIIRGESGRASSVLVERAAVISGVGIQFYVFHSTAGILMGRD